MYDVVRWSVYDEVGLLFTRCVGETKVHTSGHSLFKEPAGLSKPIAISLGFARGLEGLEIRKAPVACNH